MLRRLALGAGVAALLALPLAAEDGPTDEGPTLMDRGMELFFEGLRREMEPTLEEAARLFAEIGPSMRSFLTEMGPALADIADQVEDWSVYEMPEILPNGDIIIRRKDPQPETTPKATEDGSIEL
ncbi:hypothetical protein OMR53_04850 [Tritonibacter mobilis]|nr:hypothetical protein [Tritonibacter mobilis]MBU3034959.1 hypothetical protein [Tritonibacter mobilis]WHQ83998.1 hypothetical protein OMR53_04850 [Tritonibacter mobilis]